MQKDVRLQLFHNTELEIQGDNLLTNPNFSGGSQGWELDTSSASFPCPPGVCFGNFFYYNSGALNKISFHQGCFAQSHSLIPGARYRITVQISNFNGFGGYTTSLFIPADITGTGNVPIITELTVPAGSPGLTGYGVGTYSMDWIQGQSNIPWLLICSNNSTQITVHSVHLYQIGRSDDNFIGELDATTTADFPLAITFSVNDAQDIGVRKGAYSKTFKIPATAHNNTTLKHLNIFNSTNLGANFNQKITCRVLIGNLYSLLGLLQLTSVERVNDETVNYSCVFYGDNLGWSTNLDNRYMSDLDNLSNSTSLSLLRNSIIQTWWADDATTVTHYDGTVSANTSPIIYPVATYGPTNETGTARTMQLLCQYYEQDYIYNNTYDTNDVGIYSVNAIVNGVPTGNWESPPPVVDWRPMVWVYRLMHAIFNQAGYTLESEFVETDEFKKLLYATPNFMYNNATERFQAYAFGSNFREPNAIANQATVKLIDNDTTSFSFQNAETSSSGTSPQMHVWIPVALDAIGGGAAAGGVGSLLFQAVANQSGNMYTNATGAGVYDNYTYITIEESGYYNVNVENFGWNLADPVMSGTANNNNNIDILEWVLEIQVKPPNGIYGVAIQSVQTYPSGPSGMFPHIGFNMGGSFMNFNERRYFNKGDEIRLALRATITYRWHNGSGSGGSPYTRTVSFRADLYGSDYQTWFIMGAPDYPPATGLFELVFEADIPAYGQTYHLQDVLPSNQKQIDFIKGVAHSFNMQFQTNEAEKIIYCEPYEHFYFNPAKGIDWTSKIDRSKPIIDTFTPFHEFKRRMIFKYKTDPNDWRINNIGDLFFDGVKDNFPYIQNLGNAYPEGDSIFENPFFAGTWDCKNTKIGAMNWQSNTSDNFYSASLWKEEWGFDAPEKGYDFAPRLLYYKKLTHGGPMLWQAWTGQWWAQNDFAPYANWQVSLSPLAGNFPDPAGGWAYWFNAGAFIPQATFINAKDPDSLGLSYGDYWARTYNEITNTYGAWTQEQGLYSKYYKPMIDSMLGNPKIRTLYVDLKVTDIVNLDFRKLIYVDGICYRLSKVSDWKPHLNVPTKVELIEFKEQAGSGIDQGSVWFDSMSQGSGAISSYSYFDPIVYGVV